eukprot:4911193-Amphidinium_carterae.1
MTAQNSGHTCLPVGDQMIAVSAHVRFQSFAAVRMLCRQCMHDPVVLTDGHTYERRYIDQWLDKSSSSAPLLACSNWHLVK